MSERPRTVRPLGRLGQVALAGSLVAGTILASGDPFVVYFFLSYAAVGAFLAFRRPTNSIGWLLIAMAFGWIAATATPVLDIAALSRGQGTVHDELIGWIETWASFATLSGLLALSIVFPSGYPHGRERRVALILSGVAIATVALSALAPTTTLTLADASVVQVPNPLSVLPDLPLWSLLPVLLAVWFGSVVIGVGRMLRRYRRATGVERLQLRWLVAAIVFVLAAFGVSLLLSAAVGGQIGQAAWIPVVFAYPTIPLAIGIAITRYRLYDIDRIVSRTIAYTSVLAVLGSAFVGLILALQTVLSPVTGGQTIAVAASTLAVFAIFQPVLRRVRGAVDRLFDRTRYDAEVTVRSFASRLRGDIDLGAVSAVIVDTATTAVRPATAGIWLRGTTRPDREAA